MTNIFLTGSICLSEIPREFIREASNGKKYLNIVVSTNKMVSQRGDTHNIKVSIPRDQRASRGEIFIGSLKEWESNGNYAPKAAQPQYQNPPKPTNQMGDTTDDWNF